MINRLISKSKKSFRKLRKYFKKNKNIPLTVVDNYINAPDKQHIGDMRLMFREFLKKDLKPDYILDVGAHSTEWIRMYMEFFPASTAYLIEPLAEMKDKLEKFCIDYPGSKYFLNGAGSKEGKLYLTTKVSLEGASFLLKENKNLIKNNFQREIDIITIDGLIEKNEIEIPDIVKLDVQGFELEVLKGAEKLFGKTEVFILEVSLFEYVKGTPIFSEVISFMSERGYEVYDFPGFLRRPFDGALGQIDVCFVRKNGFLRASNLWFKPE